MSFDNLLSSLGVSLASNFLYDKLKAFFQKNREALRSDVQDELLKYIKIENARIASDSIIEFLAKHGFLSISGSTILAQEKILFSSTSGTKFQIKECTSSKTAHNSIELGKGAKITGQNGAVIKQSKKGISIQI